MKIVEKKHYLIIQNKDGKYSCEKNEGGGAIFLCQAPKGFYYFEYSGDPAEYAISWFRKWLKENKKIDVYN